MNKKINVLITGCGGDIGQSIKIILADYEAVGTIVGTDLDIENYGYVLFENFEILPLCTSKAYYEELKKVIKKHNINLIIPTSEPEIKQFALDGYADMFFGVNVLTACSDALQIGFDKLATVQFLKKMGLLFPNTFILGEVTSCEYPSIIKSRYSAGSAKVFFIEDQQDFEYYKSKYPEFIIQECLVPQNEEYTCGLFRSKKGDISSIIFKRKLVNGSTGYGEVISNKQIEKLLIAIAEGINLTGSINVQLINTKKGAVVFEINPRFSSTVLFRHLLGFKDLIWSILDTFNENPVIVEADFVGKKIYRGYQLKIR